MPSTGFGIVILSEECGSTRSRKDVIVKPKLSYQILTQAMPT